jgi:hypothetical protein
MSTTIYLSSDKVKVFPAVGRTADTYPESVTTTEKSLTHLSSFPHNNDSYVISETFETPLKFIIHGYYFEADVSTYTNSLWAAIKIDTSDTASTYQELVRLESSSSTSQKENLDDTTSFKGLGLYTEEPTNTENGVYVLQLLDQDNNIPVTSKIHYYTSEICNKKENSVTTLNEEVNTKTLNATTATITPEIKYSEQSSTKISIEDSSIAIGDFTDQNPSDTVDIQSGKVSLLGGAVQDIQEEAEVIIGAETKAIIKSENINLDGETTVTGELNCESDINCSSTVNCNSVKSSGKITCNGITSNNHNLETGKYTISVDTSGNLTITENW